jgi:conjugative transfer region protein TrbK
MERSDLFRAAVIALVGVFVARLASIDRHPIAPAVPDIPFAAGPDDLSAELRRCGALGEQDAEDPRCRAVWEENRRHFFGRLARPLPPAVAPPTPAPAIGSSEGSRP